MWYVYVIRSESTGRLYVGMSTDTDRRLSDHNKGSVFSTRHYRPWKKVYVESYESSTAARSREKYFKTGNGKEKLRLILESKG